MFRWVSDNLVSLVPRQFQKADERARMNPEVGSRIRASIAHPLNACDVD